MSKIDKEKDIINYDEWNKAPSRDRIGVSDLVTQELKKAPLTSGELSSRLGRPEQLIYNTLQKLIKKGIVARKAIRKNGRELYYYGLLTK